MGESTSIAWTDHTFNPWWGCARVSPGCDHCYAETFDKRVYPIELWPAHDDQPAKVVAAHWGNGSPRRTFGDKHWAEPLKWDAQAFRDGRKHRVFCASMADIFDAEGPASERERLWGLIRATPNLTWQLLTKRVSGYFDMMPSDLLCCPSVHKGFTAEDQPHYDERWERMQRLPGVVWCSYEPALGPLTTFGFLRKPDWIVFGGESGNGFRPCQQAWAERVLAECRDGGIAFFMKQMAARTPAGGAKLIPAHLMVREFPV